MTDHQSAVATAPAKDATQAEAGKARPLSVVLSALPAEETERLTQDIVGALKTVFDPEIPADIYELGLIYRVDIEGDPEIHCAMTVGAAQGHGAGHAAMAATAMRVVNAVPYVVAAPAGLLSSLDIPNTLPRHVFQ